eukprot:CAMPEP_0119495570 /NCGR_PEP_ID=MMETSP1344-20130328/19158_1 /TAXON_ID=236787 /ORGANISM="Florenciella parvula, Strain CCMP2471" /LENGTH=165 /DNA_ID=CAMNT_0007531159 /DNA_START=95 /DNA_END=591 /DNA_ORIENTATION=+
MIRRGGWASFSDTALHFDPGPLLSLSGIAFPRPTDIRHQFGLPSRSPPFTYIEFLSSAESVADRVGSGSKDIIGRVEREWRHNHIERIAGGLVQRPRYEGQPPSELTRWFLRPRARLVDEGPVRPTLSLADVPVAVLLVVTVAPYGSTGNFPTTPSPSTLSTWPM